jgi:hypothetical protein
MFNLMRSYVDATESAYNTVADAVVGFFDKYAVLLMVLVPLGLVFGLMALGAK